jgi:hypothetical protein
MAAALYCLKILADACGGSSEAATSVEPPRSVDEVLVTSRS